MPLIKPKHQKLILQCYPSSKLSINEIKPNNAELSYLIFYAKTRRTKLEKVMNFLNKKTISDISNNRYGHLKITMYILIELIENCSDDLGILSFNLINILLNIVNLHDLSTCCFSLSVFEKYCELIELKQVGILSSNGELLNKLLKLCDLYLSVKGNDDWIRLSLTSTEIISRYLDCGFSCFNEFNLIDKSIQLIIQNIELSSNLLKLTKTKTNTDNCTINELSINSLKLFFDTNDRMQVDLSINSLIDQLLYKYKNEQIELNLLNQLIEICCKKTHIELRYRFISILINKLNSSKNTDLLIELISNLLSSEDINMVGLPILEILNDVLNLQKNSLNYNYIDIIRSLSKHITYKNQINDMILEILKNYYELDITNDKFIEITDLFICNIESILKLVYDSSTLDFKKAPYSLNLFQYLYYKLKEVDNVTIHYNWFKLLDNFYKFELEKRKFIKINKNEDCLLLFLQLINNKCNNSTIKLNLIIFKILLKQIKLFGFNFILNYMNYIELWFSNGNDFKYCLNLLVLYHTSLELNIVELNELSYSKIYKLVNDGAWYDEFEVPQDNTVDLGMDTTNITLDELNTILTKYKPNSQQQQQQPIQMMINTSTSTSSLNHHHHRSHIRSMSNSMSSEIISMNNGNGNSKYKQLSCTSSTKSNTNSINLKDLRSIITGGGDLNINILPTTKSSSSNYQRSGLAFCISGLNLSDEE
ncbi:hypothetical protein CANARDRAFT_10006 [[Candida] arabinofermentans NRRL YB-2248]|uniref:Protein EFR3 n=1 Tax=[Candida] arabinofermentans NRRL YB-2248 TaxID=983967 RepID=A0A1E4SU46_9ASCO|nr:hypothetical protein CANARDRAFT_10006 [[Candida] arabinofermentans NRRL YB-2248]